MTKVRASARRLARRKALQALYQCQLAGSPHLDVKRQFVEDFNPKKVDVEYFEELLEVIPATQKELDALITPVLDRDLEELNPIEHIAISIGVYELAHRIDIPYKVAINEALVLTKIFGAEDGHKYVNGVLDKLATSLRPLEINAAD